MKNTNQYHKLVKLVCCSFIFLLPISGMAQKVATDTTEEKMDEASFQKLKNGYNYIIRAEEEELSMFKIDLLAPTFYLLNAEDSLEIPFLRFEYEQKIKPNLSWLVGFEGQMETTGKDEFAEAIVWGGLRYYYNMNKRILAGKSANNFSAAYLSMMWVNRLRTQEDDFGSSINLGYGLQRRLGKYFYFSAEVGTIGFIAQTSKENNLIGLYAQLHLGLGF